MLYKFTVSYQTQILKDISDFMKCMDLDQGDMCIEQTITFKAKDIPIEKVEYHLKNALETSGNKVVNIKGEKMHSSPYSH